MVSVARRDSFDKLSIDGLQENFGDETQALSWIRGKFGEEITDEILERVEAIRKMDGDNLDINY